MKWIQFDQMPDLCLRKILNFLNLRDRLKCRAVNRQFKFYVEIGVDELVVSGGRIVFGKLRQERWYLTDRPIELRNSITWPGFESMRLSIMPKLEHQLKFLHLRLWPGSFFDFGLLNRFQQLVQLQFEITNKLGPWTLSLANLKVLNVRSCRFTSFVLKTPKLDVLACEDIGRIEMEYPERIKRIECDHPTDNATLRKLLNLQILVFHCSPASDLNEIRLSEWENLKELHFHTHADSYEQFRSALVNLISERDESNRDEPKLYLDEVLLVDVEQVNHESMCSRRLFQLRNVPLFHGEFHTDVISVDFNELAELDVELSSDFFDRLFPRIGKLTATGPLEPDCFEWFLQNSTAVRELILIDTPLDQAFMDRLPQINSRLTCLQINDRSDLITNFDFVLRLKQLQEFATDRTLASLTFLTKAFGQLNDLQRAYCRLSGEFVKISRCSPNRYSLAFGVCRSRTIRSSPVSWVECDDWADLVAYYEVWRMVHDPHQTRWQ